MPGNENSCRTAMENLEVARTGYVRFSTLMYAVGVGVVVSLIVALVSAMLGHNPAALVAAGGVVVTGGGLLFVRSERNTYYKQMKELQRDVRSACAMPAGEAFGPTDGLPGFAIDVLAPPDPADTSD